MKRTGYTYPLRFAFAPYALCLMPFALGPLTLATRADDANFERELGGRTYRLSLALEDDFRDLSNWLPETTGDAVVRDGKLIWDCQTGKKAGTIWCRRQFSGPTIVEFDAIAGGGANNLNFILYASHPPRGLIETTQQRSGAYSEYHKFPNYIVTYLTSEDDKWRIRFRKNPGFNLLSERYVVRPPPHDRAQRLTYVVDEQSRILFFVDGQLRHQHRDAESPHQSGFHGFRTWNSRVVFSNFKVYEIKAEGGRLKAER